MKVNKLSEKAKALRLKGFSFREISERVNISKSTASLWTRDVKLSRKAKIRLNKLGIDGRKKAAETKGKKREEENSRIRRKIDEIFIGYNTLKIDYKIECALLYWCEGTKYKRNTSVSFINADPDMIRYFLYVFRKSFVLNEKKFRALIHLHEYHDAQKQLKFWSSVTKIPAKQFNKPYLKKNTGINEKADYPGCVSIRYSDIKIYKEIIFMIEKLIKIRCGIS